MKKKINIAYPALLLMALIFAFNYSISKIILNGAHPIAGIDFAFIRVLFASFFFIALDFTYSNNWKIKTKRDIGLLVLSGLSMAVFSQIFFYEGLSRTSAYNTSIMSLLTPISVLFISTCTRVEKFTYYKLFGVLLAAVGAIQISSIKQDPALVGSQQVSWFGDVLVVGSGVTYGIYIVITKYLMQKSNYPTLYILKWSFTIGLLFLIPFHLNTLFTVPWAAFGQREWLALAYMLLIATCLAYFINIFALEEIPPTIVVSFTYLQPIFTAIIAIFLFNQVLSSDFILPSALVILGLILTQWSSSK